MPLLVYNKTEQMQFAEEQGDLITDKLDEFGVHCEIDKITIAPQVIRFDLIAAEKSW